MQRIDAAIRLGRVDAIVQSGDKNFLVPVGGAVLSGGRTEVARATSLYAGRASASPVVDLFITALSLGRSGFQRLWDARYFLRELLEQRLRDFARAREETLLDEFDPQGDMHGVHDDGSCNRHNSSGLSAATDTRRGDAKYALRNDISFAITMRNIGGPSEAAAVGARLFRGAVTGPRVVLPNEEKISLCGHLFRNYGMHTDDTPACPLLVLACGVGMKIEDAEGLMKRLEEVWPARRP
uniref:O-phosphoseryl-tRNA(Sec) selenium transferase n=1 Tax=Trypanosoma congolense (strain IL3000) TaxID=1068625 RepID=G0V2G6_TRYCI|nr:unnamed protein product [Trypanosoma congolense IL3000]